MPVMGLISRLDTAEQRISELEDILIESPKTEAKKTNKQKEQNNPSL